MKAIFTYPTEFTYYKDYKAHSGQTVTVLRELTTEEADVSPEEIAAGNEMMYKIQAEDGWIGDAFDSELEFLPSNT